VKKFIEAGVSSRHLISPKLTPDGPRPAGQRDRNPDEQIVDEHGDDRGEEDGSKGIAKHALDVSWNPAQADHVAYQTLEE
jgi:hypothetical protein